MTKVRLLSLVVFLLFSCTQGPRLNRNYWERPERHIPEDSLRVDFDLEIQTSKENQSLSAIGMILGDSLYRIEFRALLGVPVASLLGDSQGWKLYIPSEDLVIIGEGRVVSLPVPPYHPIKLDRILDWVRGSYLPRDWRRARLEKDEESLRFLGSDFHTEIWEDPRDSIRTRWIHESSFVEHSEASEFGDQVYLKKHRWIFDDFQLKIHLSAVDAHPRFSKYTWVLRYDPSEVRVMHWGKWKETMNE